MCDTWILSGNFIPAPLTLQMDQPQNLFDPGDPPAPTRRWGIFGKPNIPTRFADITDGLSCTIATGELAKMPLHPANTNTGTSISHDGWAIGDVSTMFSAGTMELSDTATSSSGIMMNNDNMVAPASDHVTGCNFGMADGSVHFFATQCNPNVFALMGSMADGVPIVPPTGPN
jgi:prepilin-type processing-associated H-X9-DG protein